ncbi:SRPBCC domain-containing protein [Fulvivirgaceae bacterium BMA12]|uniref:SRPBCC domain-containing protein n=1 Tax=Agaribacillus aureus TaxID=3051825 RepID=A0ABT8L8Z1_9BACT|nr:SRPBCC domain-containing protein [Fulvivirgaceae bacterium BMA12]
MNTVFLTRKFNQPPEVVFEALTTPDYVVQWFGPPGMRTRKVDIDLRNGGKYIFYLEGDHGPAFNIEGTYKDINPPRMLMFTLKYVGTTMSRIGESLVTIRLSTLSDGKTQMSFKQEFTLVPENMERRTKAWEAMFDKMYEYLNLKQTDHGQSDTI